MDSIATLRSYIEAILTSVDGTKILLLDDDTASMIGLVFTQTELFSHDVVLIETLTKVISKKVDDALTQIPCVALVRPTNAQVRDLQNELNSPHFGNYYLFFTNCLGESHMQQLALADHSRKVVVVHEVFLDCFALNKRLFSLGIPRSLPDLVSNPNDAKMQRIVDGLFSVLCAFKLRCIVRYDALSPLCKKIGELVRAQIDTHTSYIQSNDDVLLLLVDRRSDPITPLLHGWTYQEILHDNLGIKNNIISFKEGKETKQIVIDERTDTFFAKHLFSNYAEVSDGIKQMTVAVSKQPKPNDIKDIDELKSFIQFFPSYQERNLLASKHVTLLTNSASRFTSEQILSHVGVLEQDIACDNDSNGHLQKIFTEIDAPEPIQRNIHRLSILFACKYEQTAPNLVLQLKDKLATLQYGKEIINNMDQIMGMTGYQYSHKDRTLTSQLASRLGNIVSFVTNTNSEPPLMRYHAPIEDILKNAKEGKLSPDSYRIVDARSYSGEVFKMPAQKVIVFYVGGTTYAEAKAAYSMSCNGFDVVVGGTTVHNFESFVEELAH